MGLFRAGHAHAGVWVVLSLLIQVLLDAATLPAGLKWLARISAPVAAVGIAGGFFGIAFVQAFRWLLYFGAASLAVAVVLTGIGLVSAEWQSITVRRTLTVNSLSRRRTRRCT